MAIRRKTRTCCLIVRDSLAAGANFHAIQITPHVVNIISASRRVAKRRLPTRGLRLPRRRRRRRGHPPRKLPRLRRRRLPPRANAKSPFRLVICTPTVLGHQNFAASMAQLPWATAASCIPAGSTARQRRRKKPAPADALSTHLGAQLVSIAHRHHRTRLVSALPPRWHAPRAELRARALAPIHRLGHHHRYSRQRNPRARSPQRHGAAVKSRTVSKNFSAVKVYYSPGLAHGLPARLRSSSPPQCGSARKRSHAAH